MIFHRHDLTINPNTLQPLPIDDRDLEDFDDAFEADLSGEGDSENDQNANQ